MSSHVCNTTHPNCSDKGCFINHYYIIELAGCLFGNVHELIVSHIIDNTHNGSFLHSLIQTTGLSTQNITFALDDLKRYGLVTQHGTTVFNSLWTIVQKINITWLCHLQSPVVLSMYNAFRDRIIGTRSRQQLRIVARNSKFYKRMCGKMKRRRQKGIDCI